MDKDIIKESFLNSPLSIHALLNSSAKEYKELIINEAFDFLPLSVGIEIECDTEEIYIQKFRELLKETPGILDYRVGFSEVSFRIATGLNGLSALFIILEGFKRYSLLNYGSGIHYHIDSRYWFDKNISKIATKYTAYILEELDTWKYSIGTNHRSVKIDKKFTWCNFRSHFKTVEYRIGEMTFNYNTIIKRILHAININKTISEVSDFQIIKYYPETFKLKNYSASFSIIDYHKKENIYVKMLRDIEKSKRVVDKKDIVDNTSITDKVNITKKRTINLW